VARRGGDLDAAERRYREATELAEACGLSGLFPRANLGLVLLERGQLAEGARALGASATAAAQVGHHRLAASCRGLMAWPAAAAGDWGAFDGHLDALRDVQASRGFIEPDLIGALTRAGEAAAAAGERARAHRAWARAAQQARGAEDEAAARALERRMEE